MIGDYKKCTKPIDILHVNKALSICEYVVIAFTNYWYSVHDTISLTAFITIV